MLLVSSVLAVALVAPAFVPDANGPRSAIPAEYKWRLDALFADDAAFEKALAEAPASMARLGACEGKLAKPKQLADCLDLYVATRTAINRLTLYANLRQDSDQKAATLSAMNDRAIAAMNELTGKAGFVRRELLALNDKKLAQAYKKEPRLAPYRAYLERLRQRKSRILDAEAERVLALAGDNLWAEIDLNELPSDFEKTFGAMRGELTLPVVRDEKGQSVQLTLSNLGKLRSSQDRRVRADAMNGVLAALRREQSSLSATFAGQVSFSVFLARARKYPGALEAYLDKDGIEPKVVESLVAAAKQNLQPLHRYIALRKKTLKLSELRVHDLYVPLVPAVSRELPYEEGKALVLAALAPLGRDYVEKVRHAVSAEAAWIDVYPHKDKGSGAFASSVCGAHPYVKLNYLNELDDVSTFAHELGHAMHYELTAAAQPCTNTNPAAMVAETASTFNEVLLSNHLLGLAKSDAEKLYLLGELAETLRTTIYRQILFTDFELAAHRAAERGEALSADFLEKTYAELIKTYYGEALTLGPDDGMEWAYVPHLYYKFYTWSYAAGLASGIALAEKVQAGAPGAADAYLALLAAGSSVPPVELMRQAGIDLTKPDVMQAAARLLDATVTEMERLLLAKR